MITVPACVYVRPIECVSLRERLTRWVRGYYVDYWHPCGPMVVATRFSPRIARAVRREAQRLQAQR